MLVVDEDDERMMRGSVVGDDDDDDDDGRNGRVGDQFAATYIHVCTCCRFRELAAAALIT